MTGATGPRPYDEHVMDALNLIIEQHSTPTDDPFVMDYDEVALEAMLWQCPYARGFGICASGCWEEPACVTDGGWVDPFGREGMP